MKKSLKIVFLATVALMLMLFSSVSLAAGDGKVTVEAENTVQGIRLRWNECEGAYYYEVYRQTGKKGEKLLVSKVQTTFYDDTQTESGKSYIYSVVPAFADYTTAKESDAVTVYSLSAPELADTGSQRNGIYISWKGVKNAKGYRIYRKTAEDEDWLTVAKLGADSRSFTDGEISPTQKYFYCVKAFSGEYESAASSEKQLCYIDFPKAGEIKNTSKGIRLSWGEVSDAAYYVIYRKAGEQAYKRYALLDSTYTEYEDKDAVSGQMSSYYVCAVDAEGNIGGYDRELSVRHIRKSVITAAVNTVKGVKLYWSKSEGCQGYGIFKKAIGDKKWELRGVVYGENNLSTVDTKVKNQGIYVYTVRAFKGKNLASYDEEGVTLRFYSAPKNLKSEPSAQKGKVISWDAVDTVNTYAVYRKADGEDNWKFLGFASRPYYTDNSIKAKTKYVYGVEAYEGTVLKSGMAEIKVK